MTRILFLTKALLLLFACFQSTANSILDGDDGYRLWLNYKPLAQPLAESYRKQIGTWYIADESDTALIIEKELKFAFGELVGNTEQVYDMEQADLVISTLDKLPKRLQVQIAPSLKQMPNEGYLLKTIKVGDRSKVLVVSKSAVGNLYGSFHLLRLIQTLQNLEPLDISSSPSLDIRVLNHWDNPDRHAERGYAGQSIWDWHKLPMYIYQRYHDYARANASIGINGTVLNNVNAHPIMLTTPYLDKVSALADVFRPYGIKVYLSVKYNSPQTLGGLPTSDPLDDDVQKWWQQKADQIYQQIPDFGGFLVKANSEGQPGPGDYGRSHAEGANMLADALKPHGGIVMWRAFVYASEKEEERSKQAYSEFKPLDGKFANNVLVQVKNGPIDFQPREPVSPLFGAMEKTPLMMEFQITQEYLGFSTHSVYLGPMYEEVLKQDTYARGTGSTVGKTIDGTLFENKVTGIAGVSNIGSDRNWTGNIMLQANWYVFGRLAWDHTQSTQTIARDWIQMTLTTEPRALNVIESMMMSSHEATVNYMTPLGLHHIMGEGHHYGPAPWVKNLPRPEWTSVYYHNADTNGIGFNRSPTGVNAVEQYHSPLKEKFSQPQTTPEKYLLWFHHLPWDYTVPSSGRPLWDEIVHRYYDGADAVVTMSEQWQSVEQWLDPLQYQQVSMALNIHKKEAVWWRNACVLYFQSFSNMPIPDGLKPPEKSLKYYQQKQFPFAPGRGD